MKLEEIQQKHTVEVLFLITDAFAYYVEQVIEYKKQIMKLLMKLEEDTPPEVHCMRQLQRYKIQVFIHALGKVYLSYEFSVNKIQSVF